MGGKFDSGRIKIAPTDACKSWQRDSNDMEPQLERV